MIQRDMFSAKKEPHDALSDNTCYCFGESS